MPRHATISNTSLHLRALIPLGSVALFGFFLDPAGAQTPAAPAALRSATRRGQVRR